MDDKVNNTNDYYKAYKKRYSQVYEKNMMWSASEYTPDVIDFFQTYNITKDNKILELGCGEGRDAIHLLQKDYNLLAVDYSKTEIEIATTSCKIVNWQTLENEIKKNNLIIENKWISNKIPEFNSSMCVVVKRM